MLATLNGSIFMNTVGTVELAVAVTVDVC